MPAAEALHPGAMAERYASIAQHWCLLQVHKHQTGDAIAPRQFALRARRIPLNCQRAEDGRKFR